MKLIFFCLVVCTYASASWKTRPSFTDFGNEACLPIPKEGGNCVSLGGKVRCMNGYLPCFGQGSCGQSDVYQQELFTWDPSDGKWTCASPPVHTGDRVFGAMWSQESTSSIFFGFGVTVACDQQETGAFGDLWRVRTATNTWTNLTPTMIGSPGIRAGPAYAKISDSTFALTGGLNAIGQAQNDMYFYSVSHNTWTLISPTVHNDTIRPHGRFNSRFECSSDFGLCVLAFGDTIETGVVLNDVWTFNTNTFAWTLIAHTAPASPTQPGDRVEFCSFLKRIGLHLYLEVAFGDADDATRCDNNVTLYGDNPTNTHWRIRVDIPGGSWANVTPELVGHARATKAPSCAHVNDHAYMLWGHSFTCTVSNTTGFPLPNLTVYERGIQDV